MASRSESSDGGLLRALLAALAHSPIVVRSVLAASATSLTGWAVVRKSGNADAFVLAWIASHVRGPTRAPRVLN